MSYLNDYSFIVYLYFITGSPYYYSATSRGAGPTATATASAYDRHWPPPTKRSGGWREEEEEEGTKEGGTDSTSTADSQ